MPPLNKKALYLQLLKKTQNPPSVTKQNVTDGALLLELCSGTEFHSNMSKVESQK